ncbi:MAG: hypothetical protein ABSA39_14030, partial [Edaphobacter sp.]
MNERAKCLKVLVVFEVNAAAHVLMDNGNCGTDVSNFVRDGGYEDSRASEKLVQTRLFAGSQVLG